MPRDLLIAITAGLGGMLGWGTADFSAKKAIDQIGDIVSLVWAHVAGSLALLLFLGFELGSAAVPVTLPSTPLLWLGVAFFGALQAAVYLFVYIGFGKGQVSVLNPLFASFSGFVAIISIVFLGEHVGGYLAAALAALFAGILLVSLDATALQRRQIKIANAPGLPEIAVATALAVCWTVGWNAFVSAKDGLSFAIWMYFAMTLTLLVYALAVRVPLRFRARKVWLYLVLIGLCEALGYVAISVGYARTGHTSVVALLSGAFPLPTLLLARVFLRERISAAQRIGGLAIVGAVALLALF